MQSISKLQSVFTTNDSAIAAAEQYQAKMVESTKFERRFSNPMPDMEILDQAQISQKILEATSPSRTRSNIATQMHISQEQIYKKQLTRQSDTIMRQSFDRSSDSKDPMFHSSGMRRKERVNSDLIEAFEKEQAGRPTIKSTNMSSKQTPAVSRKQSPRFATDLLPASTQPSRQPTLENEHSPLPMMMPSSGGRVGGLARKPAQLRIVKSQQRARKRAPLNLCKVEMQIENKEGQVLPQVQSNAATGQVVKEIYMCPTNESDEDVTCDFSSAEELAKLDLSYGRRVSAGPARPLLQHETAGKRLKSSKSTNLGQQQSKLLQRRLYESPPQRKNTVGGGYTGGPNLNGYVVAYENMQVATEQPQSKVTSVNRYLGDLNYRKCQGYIVDPFKNSFGPVKPTSVAAQKLKLRKQMPMTRASTSCQPQRPESNLKQASTIESTYQIPLPPQFNQNFFYQSEQDLSRQEGTMVTPNTAATLHHSKIPLHHYNTRTSTFAKQGKAQRNSGESLKTPPVETGTNKGRGEINYSQASVSDLESPFPRLQSISQRQRVVEMSTKPPLVQANATAVAIKNNTQETVKDLVEDGPAPEKKLQQPTGTFTTAVANAAFGNVSSRRQIVEKVSPLKKVTPFIVKPIVPGELSNRDLESVNLTSRNSKNVTVSLVNSDDKVQRQRTESIEEIMKSREFAIKKPKEMLVYDERQKYDSRNSQGQLKNAQSMDIDNYLMKNQKQSVPQQVYSVKNSPRRGGDDMKLTEELPFGTFLGHKHHRDLKSNGDNTSSLIGLKAQLKSAGKKMKQRTTKTATAAALNRRVTTLRPNAENSEKQFKIGLANDKNRITFENVHQLRKQMQIANSATHMARLNLLVTKNNIKVVSSNLAPPEQQQSVFSVDHRSKSSKTGLVKNQRHFQRQMQKKRQQENKEIVTSVMNMSVEDSDLKEGNIANVIKGTGRNITTKQLKMLFNPVLMANHLQKEEAAAAKLVETTTSKPVNLEVNPRGSQTTLPQQQQLTTQRSYSYNVQSFASFSVKPKSKSKEKKEMFGKSLTVKFDPNTSDNASLEGSEKTMGMTINQWKAIEKQAKAQMPFSTLRSQTTWKSSKMIESRVTTVKQITMAAVMENLDSEIESTLSEDL